ncbi:WcaF family extracellular polysaccharide biosynthesis acetyltransferase [Exiguobacterium chiriqhucha]|uniref:WcaF family extracellular polysaccharide biosynthesis acetyltransferase n=1 Tax=Exiguobacterium chiriqhucha TaxID=1385984 RepID=UPI0004974B7B|nr:WcaF family extracellular polysaccharide biosynthesis acetyltransferase [Exiguobacterium chiriqhucha]
MILSKYSQKGFSRGKNSLIVLLWWFIQGTFFRFSLHNMYNFRAWILRIFGAEIGQGTKIRSSAKFTYPWKVKIGDYSWIGDDVILYSLDDISIGSNVVISQKSYLCTGSHDISDNSFSLITKPILVNDATWIAADCFIFPGVILGEGSVVSARSTLKDCTEPWYIYDGNPAKKIKKREIK